MGLDTTHDCWHGAYSAFHRFRHGIARAIGLDLASMQGFSESTVTGQGRAGIAWSLLKPDPIHILLNHSDCEGEIAVPNLLPLAARLEEYDLWDGGFLEVTQACVGGEEWRLRRAVCRG